MKAALLLTAVLCLVQNAYAGCIWIGPTRQKGLAGHNIQVLNGQSETSCKAACERTTGCKSIDLGSDGRCYLNSKNVEEVAQLDYYSNYRYYELACEVRPSTCVWKNVVNRVALTGFNVRIVKTGNIEACRAACMAEPYCRGIDFSQRTQGCSLNGRNSEYVPLKGYTDYVYQELACDGRIASCGCTGDPHCRGFDQGPMLHFMGSCSYTLMRDNCVNGVASGKATTEVIANYRKNHPLASVSYVREVTVKIENDVIVINRGRVVTVNGGQVHGSPYKVNDNVQISSTFGNVYVTQEGGIRVKYDGIHAVYVSITASQAGKVCGICGDANGDPNNDWTIGPSALCMDKYPSAVTGQVTRDTNVMGTSWTHSLDSDSTCAKECPTSPTPPGCTTVSHTKAKEHCNILRDNNGPFKDCLAAMTAEQREVHFDNCVFDSCTLELFDTVVCTFGETLADECMNQHDNEVSWRTNSFCPLDCPSGMTYKTCGNPCMPTCSDLEGKNCGITDGVCEAGCFCESGKVFDGAKCISQSSCGCQDPDQGVIVAVGTSFLKDDCSQTCTCNTPGAALSCTNTPCTGLEQCKLQDGVRGCYCDAPAIMVDGQCRDASYVCGLPKDDGDGSGSEGRFFFNKKKCKCLAFTYKGEGGNLNNFASKDECYASCTGFEPPAECMEPVTPGNCDESQRKYYYDSAKNKCKKFTYSGCGGSANRFDRKTACRSICKKC